MWKKMNNYYIENNGWTITKYGGYGKKYGLWQGAISKGFFDTREQANEEYKRLTNAD